MLTFKSESEAMALCQVKFGFEVLNILNIRTLSTLSNENFKSMNKTKQQHIHKTNKHTNIQTNKQTN